MIVSQWHCELPRSHCSQCLPSLSPLSLFPGSLPLGSAWIKNQAQKGKPRPNIDWTSGPQPLSQAPLFRSNSAAHGRLLAVQRDGPRAGDGRWWLRRACICYRRWGKGDCNRTGQYSRWGWEKLPPKRPEATTGETVSRPRSPRVGSEPMFPPWGSVNL